MGTLKGRISWGKAKQLEGLEMKENGYFSVGRSVLTICYLGG
jgi:hypothetical protein